MGCAIGGTLARAGADVTLINRRAEHVDAIKRHGLTLRDAGGDHLVKVAAATTAAGLGVMDLIIVLVKSFDTRAAMQGAMSLLGEHTVVLSLQNGLGHEDVLADLVGAGRVLAGKTYVGGVLVAPGVVVAGTQGKETLIGELTTHTSQRADAIAKLFNDAGLVTTVCADIRATIWDKLLINIATGALSGITGLSYGALYQVPEVRACALAAVAEAMAVAHASGIQLSIKEPVQAWDKAAAGLPYEFKASMLQSLEKGSITEVDYINGAVVERGAALSLPTPVNTALMACIKGIERGLQAQPQHKLSMTSTTRPRAYVEHVAIWVKDIQWHIRFFHEVLGMTLREVQGSLDNPSQFWTLGGMQFIAKPDFAEPEGRLGHIGVMCEDLEAAIAAAQPFDVTAMPQGRNWLRLPDGLAVELIQASPGSVAQALSINPRDFS